MAPRLWKFAELASTILGMFLCLESVPSLWGTDGDSFFKNPLCSLSSYCFSSSLRDSAHHLSALPVAAWHALPGGSGQGTSRMGVVEGLSLLLASVSGL